MRLFITAAAAVLSATQAFAGTYTVTPTFAGAFDAAFAPIADYDLMSGAPAIVQVDFIVNFAPGSASQLGFGAVTFDIGMTGPADDTSVPGWQATNPTVDTNGAAPGGLFPLFANNGDFGNGTDLVDIVVGVAAGLNPASATDPRVRVGLNAGTNVGTLFVDYAGGGTSLVSVDVKSAGFIAAGGVLTTDPNGSFVAGEALEIGVPEPTTCVLAGLALVGAAARRRV